MYKHIIFYVFDCSSYRFFFQKNSQKIILHLIRSKVSFGFTDLWSSSTTGILNANCKHFRKYKQCDDHFSSENSNSSLR